ncbi:MAG: Rnase Y domain-containing protein, partial [Christensenellaceae bacterium]
MMDKLIGSLFLEISPAFGWIGIIVAVVAAIAAVLVCVFYKKNVDRKVGDLEKLKERKLEEARTECKQLKKEAILEAKEQDLKRKNEFEAETKAKRAELQKIEQRLTQKEETLDKREDALAKKSEEFEKQKAALAAKEAEIRRLQEKLSQQHELMIQELEKVSQLTREEAKRLLTEQILEEARRDTAVQVRNMEQEARETADVTAKKVISLAVQRCAADHASEITVSVVPLPNDDMKARIIGREGRNIRALENATGIELIIDDTPEVVILSGFDPVRREIARIAL